MLRNLLAAGLALGLSLAAGSSRAYPWAAPTFQVKDMNPAGSSGLASTNWFPSLSGSPVFDRFVEMDGVIYYGANDGVRGWELWRSDGTAAGTYLVKDINPGPGSSMTDWPWSGMAVVGQKIFLSVFEPVTGYELWVSDGTAAGTTLVKDINPGAGWSLPDFFIDFHGTAYFRASDGVNGSELWKSDGTPGGTVMVKDIRPGAAGSSPAQVQTSVLGNTFVLGADDGTLGNELWVSDGTTAGTVLLKDINPGPAGSNTGMNANINGTIYAPASTAAEGRELWRTDGTPAGTVLVKDINPGPASSNPARTTNIGGTLFFQASDGVTGTELWKSNGSAAGTARVSDINPGAGSSSPRQFIDIDGTAFFQANDGVAGMELWRSDGTAAGTTMVRDIAPGATSSNPMGTAIAIGGTLVFSAFTSAEGFELWTSDGTAAGTVMAPNFLPGTSWGAPRTLTYVAARRQVLYRFDTPNGDAELWSFFNNKAPDVSRSFASPGVLWPPNHEMVSVEARGVVDPDDDEVTVVITSVFSDESLDDRGDGNTSPDAELLGGPALVRSERQGGGNGRVYTLTWTATDPFGASSTGRGTVCVPHDSRRSGAPCVDDGPLFDATSP